MLCGQVGMEVTCYPEDTGLNPTLASHIFGMILVYVEHLLLRDFL